MKTVEHVSKFKTYRKTAEGEQWPVKKEIFEATYEEGTNASM